ncbi:MAG: hypothetical protein ACYDCN_06050 [Bacteroidia bacterium]
MKEKHTLKTLLTACCFFFVALSQAQILGNPYWCMPPNFIPQPVGTPSALPTQSAPGYQGTVGVTDWIGATIQGPNNMYCDASGKPLFSIVSGYIFNPHGFLIDTLIEDTVSFNVSGFRIIISEVIQGWTEACVVPNPANCKQYYVFTAMPASPTPDFDSYPYYYENNCQSPYTYPFVRPYFTLIDVSQQGSYMPNGEYGKNLKPGAVGNATAGDLYSVTSTTGSCSGTPFKGDIHYGATGVYGKGSSTPYRLLFLVNNDEIITYKVTGTGTYGVQHLQTYSLGNLTSACHPQVGNLEPFVNISELELYQTTTGSKPIQVAFAAPTSAGWSSSLNSLVFMNFDTTGNYIANTAATVFNPSGTSSPYYLPGIEFSPNGQYVYVTHSGKSINSPSSGLTKVTYTTGTTSAYYGYSSVSGADTTIKYSQIETGTDGNLYLIDSTSTSGVTLAKITSPNSTPSFSTNILSLSGYPKYYPGGWAITIPTYFLPDQIDQEVYGSQFNSNTACCLFYTPYDRQMYSAGEQSGWTASSQTWTPNTTGGTYQNNPLTTTTSSTVTIGQELRIPAGYTITISNMTLKFSPQARLIIENAYGGKNGGRLVLNGCTLTVDTRCKTDMWPGIQVWGNPLSGQTGINQGWLRAYNNTVIENAYVGVLVGYDTTWLSSITPRPSFYSSTSGCGFTAANSFNNGSATTQGQGGGIIQCDNAIFLNNQRHAVFCPYASSSYTLEHFNLCTFNVNAALLGGASPTHFVDMYYYTGSLPFPINGCSFADTHYYNYNFTGIWTINSDYWVDEYSSTRSTFNNFLYGIYSKNLSSSATIQADHSTFTNNKVGIYLGNITNATVNNDSVKIYNLYTGNCSGLYLDNCTGYNVQGNYITKGTGSYSNNRYGILVYNSGHYVNCIYNNTFTNVYKGSQAQYRNYASAGSPLPQNYLGLVYLCNIFVPSTISGADIYVPARGSGTNVGATYYGTDTAGIMFNQGTQSAGYPQVGGNLFSHTTGGSDYYIEATAGSAIGVNYIYYCASGTCPTASNHPYNNISSYVTVASYSVSDVNCSTNPYTNGLRTTNPLTNMLSEAATYKTISDSIETVINSLPQNDSRLSKLGQNYSIAMSSRHRLIDEAIHYLLNNPDDSTKIKVNSLMKEKAMELPPRSKLETALTIHDSIMAASALAQVANAEGQNNYVRLHTILLQNLSKTPEQIMKDASVVSELQTMAKDSSDHTTYLKAHILLSTVGLSNYQLYYQEGELDNSNNDNARAASINTLQGVVAPVSTLINSPNPFKESTVVKAVIVEKTQNAYIVITDVVGNEIVRYPVQQGENNINVNADGLNQAVMFCTLVVDGVKIKTNKMVLIR